MHPDVIIIRGAPGVGKSSVAKILTARLGAGVKIEIDTVRAMITGVDWTDTSTHINAIRSATALVLEYLALGYRPVILVDTLSGDTLGYVTERLEKYDWLVFSLIATDIVLEERILSRNGEFMDYERSFKVNRLVVESCPPNNHVIETSKLSVTEVCNHIVEYL
jgi:broad-specificity NMP kinase